MSDVGVAPAVFTAPVSQLPDFLVALAVNAAKTELQETDDDDERDRENRNSELQRASCAMLYAAAQRAHRVNVAASRAQLASDNEHSKVNMTTKGSSKPTSAFLHTCGKPCKRYGKSRIGLCLEMRNRTAKEDSSYCYLLVEELGLQRDKSTSRKDENSII